MIKDIHLLPLAKTAISIAEKYASKNENAMVGLNDSITCLNNNRYYYAIRRAADSLLHSISLFSPDTKSVIKMIDVAHFIDHFNGAISTIAAENILNENDWDVAKAIRSLHIA